MLEEIMFRKYTDAELKQIGKEWVEYADKSIRYTHLYASEREYEILTWVKFIDTYPNIFDTIELSKIFDTSTTTIKKYMRENKKLDLVVYKKEGKLKEIEIYNFIINSKGVYNKLDLTNIFNTSGTRIKEIVETYNLQEYLKTSYKRKTKEMIIPTDYKERLNSDNKSMRKDTIMDMVIEEVLANKYQYTIKELSYKLDINVSTLKNIIKDTNLNKYIVKNSERVLEFQTKVIDFIKSNKNKYTLVEVASILEIRRETIRKLVGEYDLKEYLLKNQYANITKEAKLDLIRTYVYENEYNVNIIDIEKEFIYISSALINSIIKNNTDISDRIQDYKPKDKANINRFKAFILEKDNQYKYSRVELEDKFSMAHTTIDYIIKDLGLPKDVVYIEDKTGLDTEEFKNFVKTHTNEYTIKDIATKYEVSDTHIVRLIKRFKLIEHIKEDL